MHFHETIERLSKLFKFVCRQPEEDFQFWRKTKYICVIMWIRCLLIEIQSLIIISLSLKMWKNSRVKSYSTMNNFIEDILGVMWFLKDISMYN